MNRLYKMIQSCQNDTDLFLDLAQISAILDFTNTGEQQNHGPAPIQSKIYINLLVDIGS